MSLRDRFDRMPPRRLFGWHVVGIVGGIVVAMALVDITGLDNHPTDRDGLTGALMIGAGLIAGSAYGVVRRARKGSGK